MTKREILLALLRNYRTVEATLVRSEAGSGGHVPMMPEAWNGSYRELERCLHVLSERLPGATRMLLAMYVDPTISRRTLVGRIGKKKGGKDVMCWANHPPHSEVRTFAKLPEHGGTNQYTVLLATWPDWVRADRVEEAMVELEGLFRHTAQLPTELLADA